MRARLRLLTWLLLGAVHGAMPGGNKKRVARPELEDVWVDVLIWFCEVQSHEADALCNLLWTHRHLKHTEDMVQMRGLNRMMHKNMPKSIAEKKDVFGPIVLDYCKHKKTEASVENCKDGEHGVMDTPLFKEAPEDPETGEVEAPTSARMQFPLGGSDEHGTDLGGRDEHPVEPVTPSPPRVQQPQPGWGPRGRGGPGVGGPAGFGGKGFGGKGRGAGKGFGGEWRGGGKGFGGEGRGGGKGFGGKGRGGGFADGRGRGWGAGAQTAQGWAGLGPGAAGRPGGAAPSSVMASAAAKLAVQQAEVAAAEDNAAATRRAAEAAARAFVPRRHRHGDAAKAEEQEEKFRSAYADKLLIDLLLWTCRDEIQEAEGDDSEAEARHAESADAARLVCKHLREASIQLPAALRHWEHDVYAVDEAQLAAAPVGSDEELGTPIGDVRIAEQRVKRFISSLPRARRGGSTAASSHASSLVDSMAGVLLLISMCAIVAACALAARESPSGTSRRAVLDLGSRLGYALLRLASAAGLSRGKGRTSPTTVVVDTESGKDVVQ